MLLKKINNKFIYYFLIFGAVFGVVLYNFIESLGFTYIDELMALFLMLYTLFIASIRRKIQKYWLYLFSIFGFYLFYSFYIHSNLPAAIFQDFIIQTKPFIGFFCIYSLAPLLTDKQKKKLVRICYFCTFCLLLIAFDMNEIMGHPSRYATAVVCVSLLFLYASKLTKKNIAIFIIILTLSLLSAKGKAFGFYVIGVGLIWACYKNFKFKFSIKTILTISVLTIFVLYAASDKINYYFIEGSKDNFARPVLYITSQEIISDYVPFGSGFASFGTYSSAIYYSKIYEKYGIDKIQGLKVEEPGFIADTYFPVLAQFGVVGIILFILFWIYLIRKNAKYKMDTLEGRKIYFMTIVIILFFLVESVADSTFTQNRGFFIMMILGLCLSDCKNYYKKQFIS